MFYSFVLSTAFALALSLPLMFTPVTLGVWIFMLALSTASFVTLLTSSWFGLILFIIYIGGMLVMFSYFVATAPNQKLSLILPLTLFCLLLALSFYFLQSTPFTYFFSPTMQPLSALSSFAFLYIPNNTPILIFLAALLLLALIFVVKIANRKGGPLRPFK